jgi:hypothetical protein
MRVQVKGMPNKCVRTRKSEEIKRILLAAACKSLEEAGPREHTEPTRFLACPAAETDPTRVLWLSTMVNLTFAAPVVGMPSGVSVSTKAWDNFSQAS